MNGRTKLSGELLVAVDGGGTKTDVVVADLDGVELISACVGATNHERLGTDQAARILARTIDRLVAQIGASNDGIRVAVFGLAGIDWDSDVPAMEAALRMQGFTAPMLLLNDSEIALRAGCSQGWGVVSSAGTESVAAGVNREGQRFRTMAVGWGEPCGARSMVHGALTAVAREYHRTGPTTVLTAMFLEAMAVTSVPELFEAVTRRALDVGPEHAPLLDRAISDGDEVALQIVEHEARSHADVVGGIAERLAMSEDAFELVTSGSIHANGGHFRAAFEARVLQHCPRAQIVPLRTRPVLGAVLLAVDATRRHERL